MALENAKPDDLDRLLTNYFHTALPRPWPAAPVVDIEPYAVVAERASPRSAAVSRGVLAASIALLAGVCWYVGSGTFTTTPRPQPVATDKFQTATAGDADILDELARQKSLDLHDSAKP